MIIIIINNNNLPETRLFETLESVQSSGKFRDGKLRENEGYLQSLIGR